jgi:hypothetical protein
LHGGGPHGMKLMCNNKNMMNKEFQLNMESKLIEVSKMKMQKIQFVSMMTVIQMKLMKVNNKMKNMMIPNASLSSQPKPAHLTSLPSTHPHSLLGLHPSRVLAEHCTSAFE